MTEKNKAFWADIILAMIHSGQAYSVDQMLAIAGLLCQGHDQIITQGDKAIDKHIQKYMDSLEGEEEE